jgi:hypothetical protein
MNSNRLICRSFATSAIAGFAPGWILIGVMGFGAIGVGTIGFSASAQAITLVDQIGADPALTLDQFRVNSQDFEAAIDEFDSASVDDFTASSAVTLSKIEAVVQGGTYQPVVRDGVNQLEFFATTYDPVQAWLVEIYSSRDMAQRDVVGDIASFSFLPNQVTLDPTGYAPFSRLLSIPVNLRLDAGTYWLAVRAKANFTSPDPNLFQQFFIHKSPLGDNNALLSIPGLDPNQIAGLQGGNAAYRVQADAVPVPLPSLLPGVVGMGIATLRRRKVADR